MRRSAALTLLSLGALTMIGMAPPPMAPAPGCEDGVCSVRLTAPQLLHAAEKAVLARQFAEARAMLAALAHAPELSMETHFLNGYMDAESGDLDGAARNFRAVLRDRPDMTRARLELARVLMLQGKDSAADHHFRLAEEAPDLPPEIEQTIRSQRGIIRNRRVWHLNIDGGLAPDSNLNGATNARSIDTVYRTTDGDLVQLALDDKARRRSGLGQYAKASGGVRLRLKDGLAMLVDADASVTNYKGKDADDISALIAAGPELTMTNGTRVSIEAVGVQRWYGGRTLSQGGGARIAYQQNLGRGARIGVQAETRRVTSDYGPMYQGWQHSLYATYERVVDHSMVASASLFARREDMKVKAYSSTEVGANAGIGGELPFGINAGLSAGVSRAWFDAPIALLSADNRHDWRFTARAYAGARSIRVLGFSPSITYTYNRIDSTLDLYRTARHRVQLGLARYF